MQKLSRSKQVHYRTAYKKLSDIAFVDLTAITIKDLQTIVNEKAPTYYPAKDMKTLLVHLYDLAVADQYVTVNLADYIELPALEEESPKPFTEQEVRALWADYLSGNYITGYALLMIYTGMMPGELFELRPEMIDCDLYRFLEGDEEAVNAYFGEYMSQYTWASNTEAQLAQLKKQKI